MAKTKSDGFIKTPLMSPKKKDIIGEADESYLSKISSARLAWHLVRRHKFGLVLTWAVVITISWAFPPFWDMLGSVVH